MNLKYLFIAIAAFLSAISAFSSSPVVKPKAGGIPVTIKADRAELERATQQSIYTGNVRLERGGLTMVGDKLVVTRNPNTKEVLAVLTGSPAKIQQLPDATVKDEMRAQANRVEYTLKEQSLSLIGNAIFARNNDRMAGEEIRYDAKNGRVLANGNANTKGGVVITFTPDDLE